MNRSSVSKNTRKNNNKDKFNPKSNPIIAKHWDPELTAKQNYKKLGLTFKLSAPSGGEEKKIKIAEIHHGNMEENLFEEDDEEREGINDNDDSEEGKDPYDPANILEGTAKFVKDENGKVLKIIYGTKKISQPNNKINDNSKEGNAQVDDEEDKSEAKEVIAELEELASIPKKKEVRKMNEVEIVRYRKLLDKYGEDYERMKWDKKLNPFQLSPGQLKKQIKKYLEIYGDK